MKRNVRIITLLLCLFGFGSAWADDTDIYGGNSISIEPNVLIVFDTSGSMSSTAVAGPPYSASTTYTGAYTNNAVYERGSWNGIGYDYNLFASDVSDLNCGGAVSDLNSYGYDRVRIQPASGSYVCGGWRRRLYLGNRLNYEADPALQSKSRMDVAKEVVVDLINNNPNIRFGLMRFNYDQGGRLTPNGEVGASHTAIISDINALTPGGMTPLAETLAEAGNYFAGQNSWWNSGVSYTSPIDLKCRKNYVILMTDGFATSDSDAKLSSTAYLDGVNVIGDFDNDSKEPGDSLDYLDDVASYLLQHDMSTLGTPADGSMETQNVVTYTIGFQVHHQLLQDTANNGGGQYYTANSYSGLQVAFQEIINDIAEVNAVFVSPVVPISRMNRVFAGNYLYIGFFKPQAGGDWLGNVKRYGLDISGSIVDANNNPAILSSGMISPNAQSYWSPTVDGPDVSKGGVGELITTLATRNLYTNISSTSSSLTDSTNAFTTANSLITPAVVNKATTAEKDAVINDIHGVGKTWMMGDVLHSEPEVVHYDTDNDGVDDESVVYVGTNGGVLHAFINSTGAEAWGFIPQQQLSRLGLLSDTGTAHDYFEDGTPAVYEYEVSGTKYKTLIYGERRGGSNYYALNVSTYNQPSVKFTIDTNFLGTLSETLGQSWGKPRVAELATSTVSSETVFLLPGGYDTNQDLAVPASDTQGRAVLSVRESDGAVSTFKFARVHNNTSFQWDQLTHSIVDLAGLDPDGDGITNRIYAPDLGGNMFAFHDDDKDGTWDKRKLFSASALDSVQRKIFYAPDAIKIYNDATHQSGEYIFFGTGDRADPEETGVVNRFYAVKNYWDTSGFSTLNENDLHDATDNDLMMGSASDKLAAETELNSLSGWFIELENPGEKMIADPLVFGKVVYFTTYEPEANTGVNPTDPCDLMGGRGTARLYALDYETGIAVEDFSNEVETDDEGNAVTSGGKKDRSKIIGTSIPSSPVIAILPGGVVKMYIGVEGGIIEEDPVSTVEMNMYYWRDLTQ